METHKISRRPVGGAAVTAGDEERLPALLAEQSQPSRCYPDGGDRPGPV